MIQGDSIMANNNDQYRERAIERLKRQLKRSKMARSLSDPKYRQRRITSSTIYTRKLKHLKNLLEE